MQNKHKKNDFLRFLKDEKFIEWKLFPSDELTAYWENFLQEHPNERENMTLAEEHFRNIRLSSYSLSPEKKEEAIIKLEHSIHTFNTKRKILRVLYVAAACAAIFILSVLYIRINNNQPKADAILSDYIVGSELQSENIRLITNNKTTSFQENINIEISNTGVARIKTDNENQEDISMDEKTLNTLIVPYGKRSSLTLADGSKVWLNSGSTLIFPTQFTENNREIHLTSGEMYIEVAPDSQKPFYVHTSDFNVKVYGTKFNVSAYTDSPQSVVLIEGRVSLQHGNKQETFLSPNEQAIYADNGTFNKQKVNVNQFICWKEGYLEFDDTPMEDVLLQIGRYYNLSFNYDKNTSLKGHTCTGKIILFDNLDNVMTTLALISSTTFTKEGKQIYITINPNKTSMPMEK
ncbi:MAG: fec operon regulator FecR [Bacteroidetes bacterium ADurb.BinA174]|nr:MAG: fec operon regulator FecR [Bacteroidetes bacterium ADurb.BinA174]